MCVCVCVCVCVRVRVCVCVCVDNLIEKSIPIRNNASNYIGKKVLHNQHTRE